MSASNNKLVIAVSSRALFNLEEEHALFESQGINAYRQYQLEHLDTPLAPGVAFPFIHRFLQLNKLFPSEEPFQVVVLSKNSPETSQRFFNSCRFYNLPIKSGAFTSGQTTFPYLESFDASLFLSADKASVQQAISQGFPAGWVVPSSTVSPVEEETSTPELRIAFDFDGVIIDDEAERQYQKDGLTGFTAYELEHKTKPHTPGPLHKLFTKLAKFQDLDAQRGNSNPYYHPAIRISIVTARGAPSDQRLITTLQSLGMHAAELFLLDGHSKASVLNVLKPHIFFDDQLRHLEDASHSIPCVLIPFGVTN